MVTDRAVKIRMTPDHAESVLNRFYQARYEDKDDATFVFTMDVEKGIKELEKRFPELAKDFEND